MMRIGRNWLRNRKAVQMISQDQQRIRAEIRAGKDPEDVLGGFDLTFGLKIFRHLWIPPTLIIGGSFSYVAWRVKYDIDFCYEMMSWCTEYDHLVNLIWKIEWIRPNFKQELFDSYASWLDEANKNPEEFIKNINFAQFDKWCDWIEKLKYEEERQRKIHEKFQQDILLNSQPPMIRKKKTEIST